MLEHRYDDTYRLVLEHRYDDAYIHDDTYRLVLEHRYDDTCRHVQGGWKHGSGVLYTKSGPGKDIRVQAACEGLWTPALKNQTGQIR